MRGVPDLREAGLAKRNARKRVTDIFAYQQHGPHYPYGTSKSRVASVTYGVLRKQNYVSWYTDHD